MSKTTISTSPLTNRIFVGKAKNNKWIGKKEDVTAMAIDAVVTFLLEGNKSVHFEEGNFDCKLTIIKTPKNRSAE